MNRLHVEALKTTALEKVRNGGRKAAIVELARIAMKYVAIVELGETIGKIHRVLQEENDDPA